MNGITDFHTHAFPDSLAPRAIPHLEAASKTSAYLDGTVTALLRSMDRAGIERSVVCSIATRPEQFPSILQWSREIASGRIIPFPSLHPCSPAAVEEAQAVAAGGFSGIKLHPEYQDFHIDDPSLDDFYREAEKLKLIVLFHAGYDIGFPDSDRSDPVRIGQVHMSFPNLKVIASHLGGFRRWNEALLHLAGRDVYLDTSFTIGHIPRELLREIVALHSPERLLFGSDSPWTEQRRALEDTKLLKLDREDRERLLRRNADELLGEAVSGPPS